MSDQELYDYVATLANKHVWTHPACYSFEEAEKMLDVYRQLRSADAIKKCNTVPEVHQAMKDGVGEILLHLAW